MIFAKDVPVAKAAPRASWIHGALLFIVTAAAIFLLLFTYVFGGAIGGSPHTYLMFALPGIIVQNLLFTTLNTATGLSTDLEARRATR